MDIVGEAAELRVYIGESDHYRGRPLFQAIVSYLKEQGMAGVTVLRGVEGFGAHSRIHTANILRLSEDLPLVVVTVDTRAKIERILPTLDEMVSEGLITVHDVRVIKYAHRQDPRNSDRHASEQGVDNEL